MKVLKALGALVVGVCTVGSFALDILRDCGVPLPLFLDSIMQHSSIWLPILALSCGILIGWNAKKRQAAKDADEMGKQLKDRDRDIAELQKQADELTKQLEKGSDQPEPLKGEAALNYFRSLTDNQHAILKEMLENGGSLEADPFDSELGQLKRLGMVMRPSEFYQGFDVTWTLPPDVNMTLHNCPEVLESEEEKRKRELEEELDQFTAAQLDLMTRIADACDEAGFLHIPLGSQDHKIAMPLMDHHVAMGDGSSKTGYDWRLLPDWNKFVKRNRAKIDERTKQLRDKREKKAEDEMRRKAEACLNVATLPPRIVKADKPGSFYQG